MLKSQALRYFSLVVGIFAATGCRGSDSAQIESTTVASTNALSEATDTAGALELRGMLDLARLPSEVGVAGAETRFGRAPGALHCDDSPDVTYATVCGKQVPATAHFEWTSCKGGDHGVPGAGAPSPDHMGPRAGERPNERTGSRGEHGFVDSAGTVDIKVNATAPATCDASTEITLDKNVTFDVTHKGKDGSGAELKGSTETTTVRTFESHVVQSRNNTFDTTRSRTDATGAVVQSLHLKGTSSEVRDDSQTPVTRTFNGDFSYDHLKRDGTTSSGQVKVTDLVRVAPDVCFWPLSGTIVKTAADGTTQTLTFSGTCGSATLDGTAIDLTAMVPERDDQEQHDRPHH